MKIAEFFPSTMRVEIVREMVKKMGIRPVSNYIGVNSKTVYKYNLGEAVPRDETLVRLLQVLREKDPGMFWECVEKLQRDFEEALSALREGKEEPVKKPPQGVGMSRFEVYEKLGIENPSERMRLARILSFLTSQDELNMKELEEKTMLLKKELEDYVEKLLHHGILERTDRGTYRVRIRCRL
ncbi:MAG: hypothetical protein DSO02_02300 [Hadesarchaea archaeon]|nr:MAG: hypothetical protein DSO03_00050 [Hadesarchaea archaeon]TDA34615.1 MAG: hypothetical protein DSO02_02300 [Hadesarchaea archaeon]